MDDSSGIGVLDKIVAILDLLAPGPAGLPEITKATQLPKPTAHRLLQGLAHHGVLTREPDGRYVVGPRVAAWSAASSTEALVAKARAQLDELRETTGLSAQLYVRSGEHRLCVATSEPTSGLRDTVPVGSSLTMHAGSAAQVLAAWESDDDIERLLPGAAWTRDALSEVRRSGWAESSGEREPGVASVSAPVRQGERVTAAISVSGPIDTMTRSPGRRYADLVVAAAARLSS